MAKTPVPQRDGERCFQDSECAHADPRDEFSYTKPVTRPVISRSKSNADAGGQRRTMQDDGPRDAPLK